MIIGWSGPEPTIVGLIKCQTDLNIDEFESVGSVSLCWVGSLCHLKIFLKILDSKPTSLIF